MQQAVLGSHADEDQLEEYLFDRLPAAQVESIEEHLLVCQSCRDRLDKARDFVVHARAALKTTHRADLAEPESGHRHRGYFRPVARPVWAITLAGVALVAVFTPALFQREPEYYRAELTTYRGAEINTAQVPASKAPEIVFDRATLPVRDSYRIEVVTASGSQVYSGAPVMDALTLTARVPKRLSPGRYWARVYSGGDLLKESGFEVVP